MKKTPNKVRTEYNEESTEYNKDSTEYNEKSTEYNEESTEYNEGSTEYNGTSTEYNGISTEYNEDSTAYKDISTEYNGRFLSQVTGHRSQVTIKTLNQTKFRDVTITEIPERFIDVSMQQTLPKNVLLYNFNEKISRGGIYTKWVEI